VKEPAATTQQQRAHQHGLIIGLITLPWRLFGVLVASLLLSIVIECVGMHLFWPDQGWRHAQGMLEYELDQLSTHFTRSAVVQEPGRTARSLVEGAYEWIFVKTGLIFARPNPHPSRRLCPLQLGRVHGPISQRLHSRGSLANLGPAVGTVGAQRVPHPPVGLFQLRTQPAALSFPRKNRVLSGERTHERHPHSIRRGTNAVFVFSLLHTLLKGQSMELHH
jgi:hypothetical protein